MQQTRLKIAVAVLAACLLTASCHRRVTHGGAGTRRQGPCHRHRHHGGARE